jgi:hypothetical protein
MEPDDPRSTVVELRWRPCLAYYEQGVALLRSLENAELLRRFRVGDHSVEAQLADGAHASVGVAGMSYREARGAFVAESAERLIDQAVALMRPADVRATFYLQHLRSLEWDCSYEEACARATAAWMPALVADAGVVDSAPLVDGVSMRHRLSYQAEFGVVSADEAPERLSRNLGNRIGGPVLPPGLEDDEYPRLGMFVDSSWFPQGAPAAVEDLTGWVLTALDQARQEAWDFTTVLHGACHTRGDGGGQDDSDSAEEVRASS